LDRAVDLADGVGAPDPPCHEEERGVDRPDLELVVLGQCPKASWLLRIWVPGDHHLDPVEPRTPNTLEGLPQGPGEERARGAGQRRSGEEGIGRHGAIVPTKPEPARMLTCRDVDLPARRRSGRPGVRRVPCAAVDLQAPSLPGRLGCGAPHVRGGLLRALPWRPRWMVERRVPDLLGLRSGSERSLPAPRRAVPAGEAARRRRWNARRPAVPDRVRGVRGPYGLDLGPARQGPPAW